MSFQGDVAGIGLGELLQGLARGGRDGVLSLFGDSMTAELGLKGGQLFILPAPEESDDTWRERVQAAFADDPNGGLETARRSAVARAARLETFYQMLGAANLSFRFEQGPLPMGSSLSLHDDSGSTENPYGPGISVEYLLLESARITDECGTGPGRHLTGFDIPRALDPNAHPPAVRDFLLECDGSSTLQEVSDRLGLPLTQVRASVGEHLSAGTMRLAHPRELLAAAHRELDLGRTVRATKRLTGWVRFAPPGPPPMGDADLLVAEWERGRLVLMLQRMDPSDGRTLLRRIDHVHTDLRAARNRWRALREAHRNDDIALLHEITLRFATAEEADTRTFHDLLRLAGQFQERGQHQRTRALLRMAASHLPSRPKTRIELGRRMMETGLVDEGIRWLLDTARELVVQGEGERAMVPVRAVLKLFPDHTEANAILTEARNSLARKKRRRWNTVAALSTGLILSMVGAIKYRSYRATERVIEEINSNINHPEVALRLIQEHFPADSSQRVVELRVRFEQLQKEIEKRLLDLWSEKYTAVAEECEFGDPLLGLRRALDLPPAPDVSRDPEGNRQDLLGILARRLGKRSDELNLPVNTTAEELKKEEQFVETLTELEALIGPDPQSPEVQSFAFRLDEMKSEVLVRREKRFQERVKMLAKEKEKDQDILLATARAHDQAGDLERAVAAYDRLLESDPGLSELPDLQREIAAVRRHWSAVERALELARQGKHGEAEQALAGICPRPVEHLLPYHVDSKPSRARVTLPGGRVRTTPFEFESGVGESVELVFEAPGHAPRRVQVDHPHDMEVHLHLFGERQWKGDHKVEAAPVAVGDDHIVCDRAGAVARVDRTSAAKWEVQLQTLGGIARTPIFLPHKPGHLLILSEDGKSWLLDASNGRLAGPREIGSPPVEGPTLTRAGVVAAKFADGRVAVWTDRLEPTFSDTESMVLASAASSGSDPDRGSTLVVLKRGVDRGSSLVSPWTGMTVIVREDEYLAAGDDRRGFSAERRGAWTFLAWEAPKALVPYGRLWVSDEGGLRSYVPDPQNLVAYGK